MAEPTTNSPDAVTPAAPSLTPVGGAAAASPNSDALSPVSGMASLGGGAAAVPQTPSAPTAAAPPPPYGNPAGAAPSAAPTGGFPQYPAAQTGAPVGYRASLAPEDDDEDEPISTGHLIGALVAGVVAGALCLLGWRWIWDTFHFNASLIAIAVGWVIGFAMLSVAQKENSFVQLGALVLGIGFCTAGVWPSLTSGNIVRILFGVVCIVFGAGMAAKAASATPDDSD